MEDLFNFFVSVIALFNRSATGEEKCDEGVINFRQFLRSCLHHQLMEGLMNVDLHGKKDSGDHTLDLRGGGSPQKMPSTIPGLGPESPSPSPRKKKRKLVEGRKNLSMAIEAPQVVNLRESSLYGSPKKMAMPVIIREEEEILGD